MPLSRLLLLGDDSPEIRTLGAYLRDAGYAVRVWRSSELLMQELRRQPADLLVLDLDALPSGCQEICTSIHAAACAPIVLLGAGSYRRGAVECLNTHADVYLDKGAAPEIIAANIGALLRRAAFVTAPTDAGSPQFTFDDGHLVIDAGQRRVQAGGKSLHLTPIEYQLLLCFVGAPRQLLSYSRLLQAGWDDSDDAQVHHVHTYVARLKRKLVPPSKGHSYFENERGVGYRFHPAT